MDTLYPATWKGPDKMWNVKVAISCSSPCVTQARAHFSTVRGPMNKNNPLLKNSKAQNSPQVTAATRAWSTAFLLVVGGGKGQQHIMYTGMPEIHDVARGVVGPPGAVGPRAPGPGPGVKAVLALRLEVGAAPSPCSRLCAACGRLGRESEREGFGLRSERQSGCTCCCLHCFHILENKEWRLPAALGN